MKEEKCNLDKVKLNVAGLPNPQRTGPRRCWRPTAIRGYEPEKLSRSRLFRRRLVGIDGGEIGSAQIRLEAACFGRFGIPWSRLVVCGNCGRRSNFVRIDFGFANKGDT